MNKVILMGRLVRNPEMRYGTGENATAVARYTLAVDRRGRRDAGGQTADFIGCIAFGKSAEFAEKYLRKGTKIAITGRIQTGSYTNREGQKVYTTDVVVEEQEFAESKNAAGNSSEYPNAGGYPNVGGYQNSGNYQNYGGYPQGNNTQRPSVDTDGFMNIPDGIEDELPFA